MKYRFTTSSNYPTVFNLERRNLLRWIHVKSFTCEKDAREFLDNLLKKEEENDNK